MPGANPFTVLMLALHDRGHQISLVARIRDEEAQHLPILQRLCTHISTVTHHKSLSGNRLFSWSRSYFALRLAARRAIEIWQPDLLHVETTQTALALLGIKHPPASYRTQDVNWYLEEQRLQRETGLHRFVTVIKRNVFRWLEPFLCNQYALMLAISLGDQRLLKPVCHHPEIILVPLAPAFDSSTKCLPAVAPGKNIVFVGAMFRDPNIEGVLWFLDKIWPEILQMEPTVHFYIVGGDPPVYVQQRAAAENQVVVTGYVEDLAPWYKAAAVFVSPLLVAGGLLQKILDAMTMGIPVVATSPCNHGISAMPHVEIVIEDDPVNFAQAVVKLLKDPELRAQIGLAGRKFVQSNYESDKAIDRWEAALLAMLPEQQE